MSIVDFELVGKLTLKTAAWMYFQNDSQNLKKSPAMLFFLVKLQAYMKHFSKKAHHYSCYSVDFADVFGTAFINNAARQLLRNRMYCNY